MRRLKKRIRGLEPTTASSRRKAGSPAESTKLSSVPHKKGDRQVAILLATILFLGAASFFQKVGMPNESSRFMLVDAIVSFGKLNIDHFKLRSTYDTSHYDGHTYSCKAPGQSFLGVPFYWLSRRVLSRGPMDGLSLYLTRVGTTTVTFGILGMALFAMARRMSAPAGEAAIMVLSYGFGSIAFIHAMLFGGHQIAAGFSFIAFAVIFTVNSRKYSSNIPAKGWMLIAGVLAGLAAISDFTTVFIAIVLWIYVLSLPMKISTKAAFAVGILAGVGALFVYNSTCFGGPLNMPYGYMTAKIFAEGARRGLYGITLPRLDALIFILFSPARGLFFIMPIFVFSALGLRRMWCKLGYRREVICILAIFLGYLWINGGFYGWHGGWTFGPRYLTPVLSFLALPLAFAPLRTLSFALLLVLSLVQVVITAVTFNQVPEIIVNPFMEVVVYLLPPGLSSVNLGNLLGLSEPWSFLPGLSVLAIAGYLLYKRCPPLSKAVEPFWLRAGGIAIFISILAALFLIETTPKSLVHCTRADLLTRGYRFKALKGGLEPLKKEYILCKEGASRVSELNPNRGICGWIGETWRKSVEY